MLDMSPSPRNRQIINSLIPAKPDRNEEYLTPAMLAQRWHKSEAHLANQRYRGEGPPYVKLPSGAILYKWSDILAWEAAGAKGVTWSSINDTLALMDGLEDADREAIMEHLRKHLS